MRGSEEREAGKDKRGGRLHAGPGLTHPERCPGFPLTPGLENSSGCSKGMTGSHVQVG